jgi:hypothetical protein
MAVGGSLSLRLAPFKSTTQLNSTPDEAKKDQSSYRHLFPIGLAFTGLNPYFKFNLHMLKLCFF